MRNPPVNAIRIDSVSYFNSTALTFGLTAFSDLKLHAEVPARLCDRLRDGMSDIALLPVIDYQRLDDLQIVPSGAIGCDGPTLTVRIFSHVPLEALQTLACDEESHTSVALAKILIAERFGRQLRIMSRTTGAAAEAQLLIGDKVICAPPVGYRFQFDLGDQWKRLTGLPFVFAIWTARPGIDLRDLPQRLIDARTVGLEQVGALADQFAVPRGWPRKLAIQYLTEFLRFDVGAAQLAAISRFHQLAARHGVIPQARPLKIYSPAKKAGASSFGFSRVS